MNTIQDVIDMLMIGYTLINNDHNKAHDPYNY